MRYIRDIYELATKPYLWIGNHSSTSFAWALHSRFGWNFKILKSFCFVAIFLPWLMAILPFVCMRKIKFYEKSPLRRLKNFMKALDTSRFHLVYTGASIFVMLTLPSVSHDYTLVNLIIPMSISFVWGGAVFRSDKPPFSSTFFVMLILVVMSIAFLALNRPIPTFDLKEFQENKFLCVYLISWMYALLSIHNLRKDNLHVFPKLG